MLKEKIKYQIPEKLKPLYTGNYKYYVVKGGRGKGATWGIADYAILEAVQRKDLWLCGREIQNSIKDSVHKILVQTIEKFKLSHLFTITDTYIKSTTGTEFIFRGLTRNIDAIKSTEGITRVWLAEANNISNDSLDKLIPTVRSDDQKWFIDFNPEFEDDPVNKRFVLSERQDVCVISMTYRDNPFFPESLRKEMEYDRQVDYEKYLWVWEGEYRQQSEAQIFKGKFVSEPFVTHENVNFYYGVDWGFSADPSTMNRCYILDNVLYIDYEAHQHGCELDDLPKLFEQIPGSKEWISRADGSRPDTISYMQRHGYPRMRGDEKLKIEDGITFMRSFKKIMIHPRCKHTLDEFKLYSYIVDKKTGDVTPKIEDKHNHHIDGAPQRARCHGEQRRVHGHPDGHAGAGGALLRGLPDGTPERPLPG